MYFQFSQGDDFNIQSRSEPIQFEEGEEEEKNDKRSDRSGRSELVSFVIVQMGSDSHPSSV